jgi:hypothetical protein
MKRGHSNVRSKETVPWPDLPQAARIPLWGGASVATVKEFPPLALFRHEWQQIGEQMGWITKRGKK